jgi:putative restriction endonuclease
VKAVFTHKAASIYDDKPEERYHFPETYLRPAEAAIDDFIIYYEPGRVGRTIAAGFAAELSREGEEAQPNLILPAGMMEAAADFQRPVIERIMSRPVRDAAFRQAVQAVYQSTCAMTGIKLINGGGRFEVQAAHIRPVAERGPDSIRNGLALSGTVHWMFDRGLVSLGDPPDYPILLSRQAVPDSVRRLFNPDMLLRKPADQRFWPAPAYTEFHRTRRFQG